VIHVSGDSAFDDHAQTEGNSMNIHLVVVRPFGTYAKGDIVTDANTIAAILGSESAANVVRVAVQEG
jgi:hypothetical protein